MPYVVTTKRPDSQAALAVGLTGPASKGYVTRRAVATLGEARALLRGLINESGSDELLLAEVPEQGGTISLADGTVIEVEPVEWPDLAERAGVSRHDGHVAMEHALIGAQRATKIIAAYNAAQAYG